MTVTSDPYTALFTMLPRACLVVSSNLAVLDANAEFCSLFSCTSEGVKGRPLPDLLDDGLMRLHADDRGRVLESLQRSLSLRVRDTIASRALDRATPDQVFADQSMSNWLFTSSPVLGPSGSVDHVVLLVEQNASLAGLMTAHQDAHDKWQESESRFRKLANKLPGIVYRRMMTADGNIRDVYVSDGVQDYLGVSAHDIMSGACRLLDFVHPEDRARKLLAMEAAAKANRSLTIEVRKIARPDNRIRWWRVHTTPTSLPEGVTQWDGFAIDITEQKQAEQQLHHAMKMDAVGQLTGGIAHDFNNLLTIILGNAESLVANLYNQPRLRQLAVLTQTAAERASDLTGRLLMFARRQSLEPKTIDVNNLVRAMEPLLRRALGEDVELCFSHGAGLWKAFVDPGQFESALLNLALNARDAMPEGGRVTIETTNVEIDADYAMTNDIASPGRYVLLAVSDNGSGMSRDTIARAFEPFFTTKPFGKGSGLGLSMVYGFMKQSGGHASIYSEIGQGTTVKLYLPQSAAEAIPLVVHDGSETTPSGYETILLAEDDDLVRSHIQEMLEALGYRVLASRDGPSALHQLETAGEVDLLLTDVVMPGGMSGKVLAEEVVKRKSGVSVLFMSGYTENAIVHHGRLDPGVHLLRKPFRLRELARKVREVLDHSTTPGNNWFVE